METEDMITMIGDPRLSLSPDQRQELMNQAVRRNWDFECPEMVVMLSAGVDPLRPDNGVNLPGALQEAPWSCPMAGFGCVAAVKWRLADLIEALSCPCVERIEGRYAYHPLE